MDLFGFWFNNAGQSSSFCATTVCLSAVEMAQLRSAAGGSCSLPPSLSSEPAVFRVLATPG